jgi:two-component system response regulator MprA
MAILAFPSISGYSLTRRPRHGSLIESDTRHPTIGCEQRGEEGPEPMPEQARILVVDDEPAVQTALARALTLERYTVAQATDGREALERLAGAAYEVVILDISMPYVDGLEVCRRLRDGGDRTPVLMLTAREQVDDRVAGLDAGADDYLVKPFALRELLARVRALLRRANEEDEQERALAFEDLRLDRLAHEAWRGQRMLQLTRTEFLLLEMFMRHPRQVLTRSAIFEHVWGYDFGSTSNSLGVYMGYLRRKTEVGEEPRLLHTVRGVGYVLRGAS